jgi:DNA-binding transcriptional LysR family regulator
MDRLSSARVFVEIVERGSLTQAAEQLDMSLAMVSRQLAAAEAWMGARLLHRTTRRLSLTEAGEAALPVCRQLLELAEELQQRSERGRREPEGRLRVSTAASFAEPQLADALVAFQRQYPRLKLELLVADRAVDLVEERIDLAVRISRQLDANLVARPLAVCRSVLCASPAYVGEWGKPADAEALRDRHCITHAFGSGASYVFHDAAGARIEVPVSGPLFTNETAVLRRLVLAGAGIAMLPTYLVADDLRRGDLLPLLPKLEPESFHIHAVYLTRKHQPLALRLLVDFLAERFAGAPWDQGLRRSAKRPAGDR